MIKTIATSLAGLLMFSSSQTHATAKLFSDDTPIKAVLSIPLSKIKREKSKDVRPYHEGTFSYVDGDQTIKVPVKVKTRGNFRREQCKKPPLRLKFDKMANKQTLLKGQKKLKLVAPCEKGASFKRYIGLEYVAYQMYEEISDYHFKTRIIEMNFVDTSKKKKPLSETTFIIEDIKGLAKRAGMQERKVKAATLATLDLQQAAILELFQLLISNFDYSILRGSPGNNCCHNVRVIGSKDGKGKLIPIPYDFDSSGWVEAPYANVPPRYPVKRVRNRYFTGICKDREYFATAIERFQQRKDRIFSVVTDSPFISDSTRKKATKYLQQFYDIINNEKKVEKQIIGRCRGKK